jgi:hypothetical protein
VRALLVLAGAVVALIAAGVIAVVVGDDSRRPPVSAIELRDGERAPPPARTPGGFAPRVDDDDREAPDTNDDPFDDDQDDDGPDERDDEPGED